MRVVYLAHPVSGDVKSNLAKARKWAYWAAKTMLVSPQAPWILYCEILDENDPNDRMLGMECDKALLVKCDELWLCGKTISKGMKEEADLADKHGIPIVHFNWDMP